MRSPDDEIPEHEPLFRGLEAAWCAGAIVLAEAVDLEGSSCERGEHRDPVSIVCDRWPSVGWVTRERLPPPHVQDARIAWETFAVDDPNDRSDAHCEVRVRHLGEASRANRKPGSRTVKEALRIAISRSFRVLPI